MLEHYKIFIASLRQIYGAKSFVFALLLLFLIATQKAESVEIINHSNIYTGITGVFSSTDYGIVFSNSLGVFSIDKETGAVKNIEFQSEYYYGFDNFFEVDGVLYFYRTEANMYEMYEGKAVYLASNVVAHYVKDNKIYIIRGKEPRIEVISSTKRDSYNTGDEGGTHFAADFIEINGDLIGFMHLNWTGTTLIFKMTDKGPEYIIAPGLPGYAAVDSAILISIREVNGEIWANSFYGNHRLVGNELLPLDEEFSFADTYLRDFYYDNGILFVLTRDSFIKTDLSTKQETILHTIPEDFKGKVSLFKGGKGIYFVINNSIYTYEPEKETLEEHQTLKNEDITIVKESKESELLVVKVDRIEWYNKPVPTVYKGNGPKTNIFLAIDYDPKNKKIVAVGQIGINLIIQEFDGENWNSFNIPYSLRYESQLPSAGLKVDLNGHYLLSIDEFFGIWDGNKWEKISFLEDIPDVKQSEKYQIFCRDSSGGLWLGASIDKFSQEENKNIVSREFWRYYNGEFQVMAKYIPDPTTGYFKKGICMRDGTVRIDLEGKNIYNMNGDKMSKILVSDGKDIPFTNENRNLSLNKDNDLILNFKAIKGWSQKHGSYVFDAGISVYSNAKWDHKKYNEMIFESGLLMIKSVVTFDEYENDWIITSQYFLKIIDGQVQIFYPTQEKIPFTPDMDNFVQIGNKIWFTSSTNGLFELNLPKATSINPRKLVNETQYILNPIVSGTHIELSEQIDSYEIYTIKGQQILNGSNDSFIDVQHIANGSYFMVGKSNNKIFVNKFLITR